MNTHNKKKWGIFALGILLPALILTVIIAQRITRFQNRAAPTSSLSKPTVVLDGNNRLESFYIGAGGQVFVAYQTAPTPGASLPLTVNPIPLPPPSSISGFTLIKLKAITNSQGLVDLFGLGSDGNVYATIQPNTTWSGAIWSPLILPQNVQVGDIEVVRTKGVNQQNALFDQFNQNINQKNNAVELFIINTNNREVWHADDVSGNPWSNWQSLGIPQ